MSDSKLLFDTIDYKTGMPWPKTLNSTPVHCIRTVDGATLVQTVNGRVYILNVMTLVPSAGAK